MGNICCGPSTTDDNWSKDAKFQKAIGGTNNSINDADLERLTNEMANSLKQKLILHFSCANLLNLDKKGKSDPFIIFSKMNTNNIKEKIG